MALKVELDFIKRGSGCRNCGCDKAIVAIDFSSCGWFQLCLNCSKQLLEGLNSVIEPESPHSGRWFKIWEQDKKNVLAAMHRNLASDLDAGYSYTGQSVQKQLAAIDEYKHEFDEQLMNFTEKSNKEVENWCYYDLKRRGAIE